MLKVLEGCLLFLFLFLCFFPVIVMGISNLFESATGFAAHDGNGFSLTTAVIAEGTSHFNYGDSESLAVSLNGVANLTADLFSLNAPSVARGGFKLFRHIPSDYVRAVDNASKSSLVLQAAGTINTVDNSIN